MEKKQNIKNFIWNLIGTGINCVTSFVFAIIITRINGIDVSGLFSVCLSVSFILYTFSNLGGRVFEVADRTRSDSLYFTLKIFSCLVSLAFGVAFSLAAHYDKTKLFIVICLTLARCIEAFSDTVYSVFQKNERLDLAGISYTLKSVTVLIVFTVVDILTKNIRFASISVVLSTLLVFVFYDLLICFKYQRLSVGSFGDLPNLIFDIKYFIVFNLVIMVIANIPRLLADTAYSNTQMGYFTIIMMIPTVMSMLGQFIIQPALNKFITDFQNGEFKAFKRGAGLIAGILTVFAALCCVAAYFLGPPILGFVMNVNLKKYAFVMVLAIISGTFIILTTLVSTLLTVMNETSRQLLLYFLALVIEFISLSLAVKYENFTVFFTVYLVSMAIQFIIFLVFFLSAIKRKEAE